MYNSYWKIVHLYDGTSIIDGGNQTVLVSPGVSFDSDMPHKRKAKRFAFAIKHAHLLIASVVGNHSCYNIAVLIYVRLIVDW